MPAASSLIVGLALIASWFVAVVFTPYLGLKLLPDFAKHGAHAESGIDLRHAHLSCAAPRHRGMPRLAQDRRCGRPSGCSSLRLRVSASFSSSSSRPRRAPNCSSKCACRKALPSAPPTPTAKEAERLIGASDPDIVTYTTYVGQGAPRFWLGLNPVLPNSNFAQIVIVTKDLAARERVKARLDKALADGALPQSRSRVDRFTFGPPVGFLFSFASSGLIR